MATTTPRLMLTGRPDDQPRRPRLGVLRDAAGAVPPALLVTVAMLSAQLGTSFAKLLFAALGPAATVSLRYLCAALVMLAIWRPTLRARSRAELRAVALLGLALAGLGLRSYAALERIPLGVTMTLQFVGPLGVAILGSRRRLDLLWGTLAAAGILVLSPIGGTVDPVGAALALLAAGFWAAYILLSARVGQAAPGGTGLALAMAATAVVTLPFGVAAVDEVAADPRLLAAALGVGLLSSVVTFSLELEALRRMPVRVFGVLMSLEPAIAVLIGLVVLGERLGPREIVAVALVVVASAGATRTADDSGQ